MSASYFENANCPPAGEALAQPRTMVVVDPNGNQNFGNGSFGPGSGDIFLNGSMNLSASSLNSSTNHHHHHSHQFNPMLNNTIVLDDDNNAYLAMNQKFSQISFNNNNNSLSSPNHNSTSPPGSGCDLNGNNNNTDRSPPSLLSMLNCNNNKPNEKPNALFDLMDNSSTDNPHHQHQHGVVWTIDFVMNNLRKKLNNIKQVQNDCQTNYQDAQKNYVAFGNICRNKLNTILQEVNGDIDQTFKNRLMELNFRKNQIEDILFKIENFRKTQNGKQHAAFNNNGDDLVENDFFNAFEADFVNIVKNVLECSTPSCEFRIPNIDTGTVERTMRSLMIPLIKQQYPSSSMMMKTTDVPSHHPSFHHETDNIHHHFENQLGDNNNNLALLNHVQTSFQQSGSWQSTNNNFNNKPVMITSSEHTHPIATTDFNRNQINNSDYLYYNNAMTMMNSNELDLTPTGTSTSGYYGQINGGSLQMQHAANDLTLLNQKQAITKSLQPRVRRERISYFLKFGEGGNLEGQFAEPSGVAVSANNDEIFIADANNHRVQVFDKWGKFKFHFGEGKLKFPNRVALSKNTGEIVVSERPPVHQIQVYGKNGTFVCKFGAKHLRHPRGLAVDHKNRVVVVECKVMRVFIFNLQGVLLHSFDCSEQIQFPNAVAVSKKEEIYISDNRNHCVKVFSFSGEFLRQIGGQGITNYPIGVCLNEQADQLLVVDNYNNLNVTIFRLDGQLIGAYESSAKHQQCLDVALFGDNSIVVTSKDLQVYFYRLITNQINTNNNNSSNNGQQLSSQRQRSFNTSNNSNNNNNSALQTKPTHNNKNNTVISSNNNQQQRTTSHHHSHH